MCGYRKSRFHKQPMEGECKMSLPSELSKKFAETIKKSVENQNGEVYIKGTIHSKDSNGNISVVLDGTDNPIPVTTAMDAEPNDRVMVMIKNHEATITGNLTSPASARTASKYMKLEASGLKIGDLENNPDIFLLLSGTDYSIQKKAEIYPYLESFSVAEFAQDHIYLLMTEDQNYGFTLKVTDEGYTEISGDNPVISIINDTNDRRPNYIRLLSGSNGIEIGGYGPIYFNSDSGLNPISNNNELVSKNQLSNFIKTDGSIRVSTTIASGEYATITTPVISVPSGYKLFGIRAINNDHPKSAYMTEWGIDLGNKKCWASVYNSRSTQETITLTFYYLLVRNF